MLMLWCNGMLGEDHIRRHFITGPTFKSRSESTTSPLIKPFVGNCDAIIVTNADAPVQTAISGQALHEERSRVLEISLPIGVDCD